MISTHARNLGIEAAHRFCQVRGLDVNDEALDLWQKGRLNTEVVPNWRYGNTEAREESRSFAVAVAEAYQRTARNPDLPDLGLPHSDDPGAATPLVRLIDARIHGRIDREMFEESVREIMAEAA